MCFFSIQTHIFFKFTFIIVYDFDSDTHLY